jgi:tetratricopeptide (TPR) repeat protein
MVQLPTQDLLKLAKACLRAGDDTEAARICDEMLETGSAPADFLSIAVIAHYRLGSYEKIINYAQRYSNILENLSAISSDFPSEDIILSTIGLAFLKKNDPNTAIRWFKKVLGVKPDDVETLLNIAAAYERQEALSEAAVTLTKAIEYAPNNAEFHHNLGKIYFRLQRFADAREEYLTAIELDPTLTDAYCNVGLVDLTLSRFEEAGKWFTRTLELAPNHEAARLCVNYLEEFLIAAEGATGPEPTLSVCMIVKNEETFIAQCLESVKAVADEIIVVDTGSTDRTPEIARKYGAQVYFHSWNNDFSEARNHSIRYATKDWILWIDADEELDSRDVSALRQLLYRKDCDAIFVQMHNLTDLNDRNKTAVFYSPKIFRRKEGFHFHDIVHNQLNIAGDPIASAIRIFHYGYALSSEKMQAKFERSSKLIQKQIDENPDDHFAHFNMAQMMLGHDYEKVITHAKKTISLIDPDDITKHHIYLMSFYQLAKAYTYLGRFEEAEQACLDGLRADENYIDLLFTLGWMYKSQKRYDKAIETMHRFLERHEKMMQEPVFNLIIMERFSSAFEAYDVLGEIYYEQGNLKKAEESYRACLARMPHHQPVMQNLAVVLCDMGRYEESSEYLRKLADSGNVRVQELLNLSKVLELQGKVGEATKNYQKILELYPDHPEAKWRYHFAVGLSLVENGKFHDAKEALQQAHQLAPDIPEISRALGILCIKLGDFEEAIDHFYHLVELNPDDEDAKRKLAGLHAKMGNLAAALEYVSQRT